MKTLEKGSHMWWVKGTGGVGEKVLKERWRRRSIRILDREESRNVYEVVWGRGGGERVCGEGGNNGIRKVGDGGRRIS